MQTRRLLASVDANAPIHRFPAERAIRSAAANASSAAGSSSMVANPLAVHALARSVGLPERRATSNADS